MKSRTLILASVFGRISCWGIGLGLIAIGIGELTNAVMLCRASERKG